MNNAYGLWFLVALNSAIFLIFVFSFTRPKTARDWQSLGPFSAFVVALFAEMYGFPLTIYFLSGWLGSRFPGLNLYSHESGHLWHTLLGLKGDPHFDIFHVASSLTILAGFILLGAAWKVLFAAQKARSFAQSGPYAYVRHPQYAAFTVIMIGFLLQWPTLLTVLMFPVLVIMYARLAKKEEQEMIAVFGAGYEHYMNRVPAFIPKRISRSSQGNRDEHPDRTLNHGWPK